MYQFIKCISGGISIEKEKRFQWSIQKSIRVKGIPWIIKYMDQRRDCYDYEIIRNDFNYKYRIIDSSNVVDYQQIFGRTMIFIRDDIGLMKIKDNNMTNNQKKDIKNYILKENILTDNSEEEILDVIYKGLMANHIPFQSMIKIFNMEEKEEFTWSEFKKILSYEIIIRAREEYPLSFDNKSKKIPEGIYFWRMDDPSINRLVQLGRLLNICSYNVLKNIYYISPYEKGMERKVLDFEDIIGLLHEEIKGFDHTKIYTLDYIIEILNNRGFQDIIIINGLSEGSQYLSFFSGRKGERRSLRWRNKDYYRFRFKEEAFKEGLI